MDKKAEDERLAKELKEIRLNRQYMNANAAMVEEKAWKELEAGAERQVRNNQNEKLIDQSKLNGISVKDQIVRADNKKNEVIAKLEEFKAAGKIISYTLNETDGDLNRTDTVVYNTAEDHTSCIADSVLADSAIARSDHCAINSISTSLEIGN